MPGRLTFIPPRYLGRKKIAQTLTVYLIGCNVFENFNLHPVEHSQSCNENRWYLDCTNDYWLHFDGDDTAHLDCRYDSQIPIIEAMLELFKVNYAQTTVAA